MCLSEVVDLCYRLSGLRYGKGPLDRSKPVQECGPSVVPPYFALRSLQL